MNADENADLGTDLHVIQRDDGEVVAGPFPLVEAIVKFTVYDASEYRIVPHVAGGES